jgi:5'-deoxynucleotidase
MPENVLEHSAQVTQVAHALAIIRNALFDGNVDVGLVSQIALYHDAAEVYTGDLPTPIKYWNSKISDAYKGIEKEAMLKLLTHLPVALNVHYKHILLPDEKSCEYIIVKIADKIVAHIKCIEELSQGNKEFQKAFEFTGGCFSDENRIRLEAEHPEVYYFIDNFLPSFKLTLDEIT